jgi:uncharacterized membrane protein
VGLPLAPLFGERRPDAAAGRENNVMASRASVARHPIHPMLVVFPIGLWAFSLACDLIYHAGSHNPYWKDTAFYSMMGGVITALAAAVPGLVDYLTIVDRRVRRIGTTHLTLNLTIVGLYVVNLWIRSRSTPDATMPLALSVGSLVLLLISGWLGGEMVYVHGMAVGPERTATTIDVTPGARPTRADHVRRPA